MKSPLTKSQAEKEINSFFKNISSKNPKEIQKIKKLAMKHGIKLGEKRKLFCKKCHAPYNLKNQKIRIKNKTKSIICSACGFISRYKI